MTHSSSDPAASADDGLATAPPPPAARAPTLAERPVIATAAVTAAIVIAVTPSFMVGASGVLLREDLDFSAAGIGTAVSVFFGSTALTSIFGGRLAERIGASRALVLAGLTSGAVLLGIGVLARSFTHLLCLLAVAGVVNGVAQPASNLALAGNAGNHQALTFGIKQAGITFATLAAGASVPLIGLTVGWRWSFISAAAVAVLVAVLMPSGLSPSRPRRTAVGSNRDGDATIPPLLALAAAAGAGMAAATAMASFLVESAVDGGLAVGTAGWLQVAGSAAGMFSRVLAGWVADRFYGVALILTAGMLLAGGAGYAMLAVGGSVLVPLGTVIAYACGWGWTGLMMFSVVRFNPNAPAAATGIVLTGSASGAALGPFVFGQVVHHTSYGTAWTMAACLAVLSTVLVSLARTWLRRDRSRRESA